MTLIPQDLKIKAIETPDITAAEMFGVLMAVLLRSSGIAVIFLSLSIPLLHFFL